MSTEYIVLGFESCLSEEGISATPAQIARMARRFELGMGVMEEATGIAAQTKPGAPTKTPEQIRIEKLLRIINGLAKRLGVGIDERNEEITFYVPCGTSHMASASERI